MVERLKKALEMARAQREQALVADPGRSTALPPSTGSAQDWSMLRELHLDARRLASNRVISQQRIDPLYRAYDVLRTRLLAACGAQGWRRIGVTSPSKRCGKTLTVVNLAFSLARHPRGRTVVLDIDLRAPRIAHTLGVKATMPMSDLLAGVAPPRDFLMRIGNDLAFGLNSRPEPDSAELFHLAETTRSVARLMNELQPDMMLFDMPPLLVGDDAMAALGLLDAVVLIAAAGVTTAGDIAECERLVGGTVPVLGIVLNRCEELGIDSYAYDYEDM